MYQFDWKPSAICLEKNDFHMFKSYANMRQPADGDGNIDHRTSGSGRKEGWKVQGGQVVILWA